MNIAHLYVSGSLPGIIVLEFRVDGKPGYRVEIPIKENLKEIIDAAPSTFQRILVKPIWRNIRQWVLDVPGEGIFAISSESDALDTIPWERCLAALLPSVVRLINNQSSAPQYKSDPLRILAAGWPKVPTMILPGIEIELNALAELAFKQDVNIRVLTDPTVEEFQEVCMEFGPDILHLIPPAVRSETGSSPEFLLTRDEESIWINVLDLVHVPGDEHLPCNGHMQLTVVNSCNSGGGSLGPSPLKIISHFANAAAFGWIGEIEDNVAADFAPFFYNRLLEGGSIISALRSYSAAGRVIQTSSTQWPMARETFTFSSRELGSPDIIREPHPVSPVLWSPCLELLTRPFYDPWSESPQPQSAGRSKPPAAPAWPEPAWPSRPASPIEVLKHEIPHIEIILDPMNFLNPALLKNGSPAIPRLVFDADEAIKSVSLVIQCDTGIGTSTFRHTLNLEKGPQPFTQIDRVQFPVLYELIDGSVDRRQINFTVTCACREQLISEKTVSVLWMGCSEWLDRKETWAYIPAFVNPYEDGVLDVIDRADEVLKSLENATSSFSGYKMGDPSFVKRQVEAVFKALRDKPFELRYINPPPIPVFVPSNVLASGQRVRTPTEVISRKRGTCHDIAVLFASCLEHIGVFPLIVLKTGHTFNGFWVSPQKHSAYWKHV
jgi:hypothetical protein